MRVFTRIVLYNNLVVSSKGDLMKIAIVGAGIGGLTLAVALKKRGIDSHVLEVANEIKAVGAGIWMPPNAMNVLELLGLGEKIKSAGCELNQMDVRDNDYQLISRIDGDWLLGRYNSRILSIERTALHKSLAEVIGHNHILTGVRCEAVEQNASGVTIKTRSTQMNFDCVIGADGIHSTVRQSFFPHRKLRYTGQTCFRGLIQHQSINETAGGAVELWGNGKRFGLSPVGNNKYYWYSTLLSESGLTLKKDEAASLLKEEFKDFPNYIKSIISSTEKNPNDIIHTDLFDLAPEDLWVQNKIALLGDAAHATTPNLGQGAAMAIEDAYVLAEELSLANSPAEAFIKYNQRRKERVNFIVATSWKFGRMATTTNPFLNSFRNNTIRVMPKFVLQKQLDQIYKTGSLDSNR